MYLQNWKEHIKIYVNTWMAKLGGHIFPSYKKF